MTTLWKKSGPSQHPAVSNYIISPECAEDKLLLEYDLQASLAHSQMLHHVGLINAKELKLLTQGLKKIQELNHDGNFTWDRSDEDSHTAIENHLTHHYGEVGKKIHMGRSRNDQVLVMTRLFSRGKISTIQGILLSTTHTLLQFAKQHEFIPMPGYTHTQQAMPSSVGQWAGSFVESLLDDYALLESAHSLNDQNPLGSAAGFGTSLPLDRDFTTQALGFKRTQINALYCQNSRGKIESFTISALFQVMLTLGKIANDLIWFMSKEFDFFTLDAALTTGSSIMPQKKNFDILEVLRANVSSIFANQVELQMVGHNLISGYHKDLKITKKGLIESFKIVEESLKMIILVFQHLKPNPEKLEQSFSVEIFATDQVNALVQQGVPFRAAYQSVAEQLHTLKKPDILGNISSKKHVGATGNLCLKKYARQIKELKIRINRL
ncbi:MAG: hypothetical protein ACD_28C00284G0007 [uncultured bacterium]|nr:MAG: hypothetical protein ACD_28C00284G0007 [uncultured bacterium]KKT74784.1 MAG: Argininosuccinate lyase [Candidatus Peregrinibacteria bacterium GW2011_GWA2_44_7]